MTCSGYLPPEYIEHALITKEYDIFSLGVIIAKLMAGREGYFKIDDMGEKRFIKNVRINFLYINLAAIKL
jgi:serine/threonine protein kinase